MNHRLQRNITDYVFDHLTEFQLVNATTTAFGAYIYDPSGEYLIGGAQVARFITQVIRLIKSDDDKN